MNSINECKSTTSGTTSKPDSCSLLATTAPGSEHSDSNSSGFRSGSFSKSSGKSQHDILSIDGSSSHNTAIYRSSSVLVPHNSITESTFTIDKLRFEKLQGELYGRKGEIQVLKDAFYSSTTNKLQLVLLAGVAGTGKSTLAQSIQSTVAKGHRGFYLFGKFDIMQEEDPYSAIGQAFQNLFEDLLLHKESRSQSHHWRFSYADFIDKMNETFDPNDTQVLSSIIPSIADVIEGGPVATPDGNYTNTKNQIQYALGRLVRLLTFYGPLVLVLDDLQWIKQETLELLQSLFTGEAAKSPFMVLLSYRDNEVDESHLLWESIQKWKTNSTDSMDVTTIEIGNIRLDDVHILIQDLLTTSAAESLPLAELVHQKTSGNVFYIERFLLSLHREKLLSFNFGAMRWVWNVDQIRGASVATDNVATLVSQSLRDLPADIQSLIPQIACLGSRFRESTFHKVERHYFPRKQMAETIRQYKQKDANSHASVVSEKDIAISELSFLPICEREHLLENCGPGWYKWVHDKIQEAALELLETSEVNKMRFDLGKLLIQGQLVDDVSGDIFTIANLLNTGTHFLLLPDEESSTLYDDIIQLNLRAGKTASAASAFGPAAAFFVKGISLLPSDDTKWEKYFQISLELFSGAAEAHFCNGDHQLVRECCHEIIGREDIPFLKKRRAYNALLYSLTAQTETEAARDLILEVLATLGCRFPRPLLRPFFTVTGFLRLVLTLNASLKEIENLQPIQEEAKEWVVYLLDRLSTVTFQCDAKLMPLAFLKGLHWTLTYGTAELTAPILGLAGVVLASSLGDFSAGAKYANLSLKYMTAATEARTKMIAYHFILHYQILWKVCKQKLLEAYEAGMKSGDLESSFWSIFGFIEMQLHTGGRLPNLLEDCTTYCSQMESSKQDMALFTTKLPWQIVANLSKPCHLTNRHILKGDIVDVTDATFYDEIPENRKRQVLRFRTFAAFLFNEHDLVVQLMEEGQYQKFSVEKVYPGANGHATMYFQCALSCISVARQGYEKSKKKKCLRRARRFLKRISDWVQKGNPNVEHYQYLLQAELSAMNGQIKGCERMYLAAIANAGRKGFINDQALAHERFADFLVTTKIDHDDAHYHYGRALGLYKEWGALAKVDLLRKKFHNDENSGKWMSPIG